MTWGIVVPAKPGAEPPPPEKRPTIPAWSYSRLSKWEACPASAYYAFILKMAPEPSPQMQRGIAMHEDAARVLTGKQIDLAKTHLSMPWIKRLQNTHSTYGNDIEVELQAAFNAAWEPTKWFGRDAWVRIVFDAFITQAGTETVHIQEHKSGKPRAEHTAQSALYAAGAFSLFPDALTYEVTINYLDLNPESPGGIVRHSFSRKTAEALVKRWAERAKPMMEDTEYPPKPGKHCSWCDYSKSKGGPCTAG